MEKIAANLELVRSRIRDAAVKSGRDPSEIKLVAVSKLKPVGAIREAYEAGQRAFGENYAQDMAFKSKELSDLDIEWHFIGHLQTNKAKLITPITSCVESIDSLKLAKELNKRLERPIDILIEVNIGQEESKAGVREDDLPQLIRGLDKFDNLNLKGLMIIPPYQEDPEASRPYFRKLGQLLDRLNEEEIPCEPLTELSMGMSHDFEVAIEEGATIVRVGTAIFGER
jgi:pyridoxal phosphate enzyme (YggS family)